MTVITQGYGPSGSGALLLTQGYLSGEETTFPVGGACVAGAVYVPGAAGAVAVYVPGAAAGTVYVGGAVAGGVL